MLRRAAPHRVLLRRGNGGGRHGLGVRGDPEPWAKIQERLLAAGYACAWLRYRTEVKLGCNNGGRLVEDIRQGRQLLNRSPSLIMGRDADHLPDIFHAIYDLMVETGNDVDWTAYGHPTHGYIFPTEERTGITPSTRPRRQRYGSALPAWTNT